MLTVLPELPSLTINFQVFLFLFLKPKTIEFLFHSNPSRVFFPGIVFRPKKEGKTTFAKIKKLKNRLSQSFGKLCKFWKISETFYFIKDVIGTRLLGSFNF